MCAAQRRNEGMANDDALICHRCGKAITPGSDHYYAVQISAIADPHAPRFDDQDAAGDLQSQIRALLDQMADQSEQELLDQVYRRLDGHLCAKCFATWIDKPFDA